MRYNTLHSMKSRWQLFLIVASIIVGFDVLGSFASRLLHFDYGSLMWVTFCLYGLCGYWDLGAACCWTDSWLV
jgi:hypothetical protein